MLAGNYKQSAYQAYRNKCESWANKITAYYLSGQRVKPFCQKNKLKPEELRKWLYKLSLSKPMRIACQKREEPEKAEQNFIPVTLVGLEEKVIEKGALDIILANGHKIRLSKDFDADTLTRLIALLGGVLC